MQTCMRPHCSGPGHVLWRIPYDELDDADRPITRRLNVWLCLDHFSEAADNPEHVRLDRPFFVGAS